MNKLVLLAAGLGLVFATSQGLLDIWGYFIGGALAAVAFFLKSGKPKVIVAPESKVPVELEKHKQQSDKVKQIKESLEKLDNSSASKLKEREDQFEKDRKSPPSVDDIRAKLESIRSRKP